MTKAKDLLKMLAGCPEGATEGALAMHGFTRALLDKLVARGAVRHWTRVHHNAGGLHVEWFNITEAGRLEIG